MPNPSIRYLLPIALGAALGACANNSNQTDGAGEQPDTLEEEALEKSWKEHVAGYNGRQGTGNFCEKHLRPSNELRGRERT